MAHFGGLTENPRRFSRSEAPPGGRAVKKGMVDYCERESGGSGNMIGAAGENGTTDDQDCESEVSVWFCCFIIVVIMILFAEKMLKKKERIWVILV